MYKILDEANRTAAQIYFSSVKIYIFVEKVHISEVKVDRSETKHARTAGVAVKSTK